MRLLWLSHFIPYPPKSGKHLRSYHLLRGVAAQHEVDLFAFIEDPWLEIFYSSRAAGMEQCARELGRICRAVHFQEMDRLRRPGGRWRTALAGLVSADCYTLRTLHSPAARRALANFVAGKSYDLVHFDTIGLVPFRGMFAETPATLGHHNIESHMLLRRASTESHPLKKLYFFQEGSRVQRREAASAAQFAYHITCSDLDRQRLEAIAPRARAVTIPNGVDVEYFRPTSTPAVSPSLIFVGSLNWYPNVDAVQFLLKEIWPLAKVANPSLRLDIVGSAPAPAIVSLAAGLEGVTLHGYVDDVRPYLNAATLYICPIRDGGGTKLKILDAFAMQKCLIAHPIACEGIAATVGRHVMYAESALEFAQWIGYLLAHPQEREEMGRAARALVTEQYSFAQIARRLVSLFETAAAAASGKR
jgi:glycosyltransferase involved in cell wall biosynthesis